MDTNTLYRAVGVPNDLNGLVARAVDIALVAGSAECAAQFRFGTPAINGTLDALFVAFAMASALALLPAFQVYQSWRGRSMTSLAGRVLLAWLIVQACVLILVFLLHYANDVSRLWFAYWTVVGGVALVGVRIVAYAMLARLRRAGLNLRAVAVVGHGAHCETVIRNIDAASGAGFRAVAIFDPIGDAQTARPRVKPFSSFDAFVSHVREAGIRELWLALPLSEQPTILRFLETFRDELINIRFVPDVRSLALFDSGLVELAGSPAINLAASPLSPAAHAQKALFDRAFAACVLILLAPLLVAIAVAVKLSSPGPVFFRQNRKGAEGRVFRIYKFRSMRVHHDTHGVVRQATRGDSRITRVGAFLRRTSLDELPQFINVLRGEMSVVGPRPHAIEHDEIYGKLVDRYIHRYRIKPGITGWAQVNGYRGETDRVEKMQRRVEHDLYYLSNWSLLLDIKIVAATVTRGFVHSNAY